MAADTVATVATALLCPAAAADCSCAATLCSGSDAVTLAVKGVMLLARASARGQANQPVGGTASAACLRSANQRGQAAGRRAGRRAEQRRSSSSRCKQGSATALSCPPPHLRRAPLPCRLPAPPRRPPPKLPPPRLPGWPPRHPQATAPHQAQRPLPRPPGRPSSAPRRPLLLLRPPAPRRLGRPPPGAAPQGLLPWHLHAPGLPLGWRPARAAAGHTPCWW